MEMKHPCEDARHPPIAMLFTWLSSKTQNQSDDSAKFRAVSIQIRTDLQSFSWKVVRWLDMVLTTNKKVIHKNKVCLQNEILYFVCTLISVISFVLLRGLRWKTTPGDSHHSQDYIPMYCVIIVVLSCWTHIQTHTHTHTHTHTSQLGRLLCILVLLLFLIQFELAADQQAKQHQTSTEFSLELRLSVSEDPLTRRHQSVSEKPLSECIIPPPSTLLPPSADTRAV